MIPIWILLSVLIQNSLWNLSKLSSEWELGDHWNPARDGPLKKWRVQGFLRRRQPYIFAHYPGKINNWNWSKLWTASTRIMKLYENILMFLPAGKKRTKLICFICNIALISQVIVFQFVYFDLRSSPSCHLGKLAIHDGDSERSPVLRTFCTRIYHGAFIPTHY